jgi:hypothetical protein
MQSVDVVVFLAGPLGHLSGEQGCSGQTSTQNLTPYGYCGIAQPDGEGLG